MRCGWTASPRPEVRARVVLCVPPHAERQWPAAELAADPRWTFGLPDPAEPELAWVRALLLAATPNGVAVDRDVPGERGATVGTARAGGAGPRRCAARRHRAARRADPDRRRRGAPVGAATRRSARAVRMVDLSGIADLADVPSTHAAWQGVYATDEPRSCGRCRSWSSSMADTALVPSRYLDARADATADDLARVTERLRQLYTDLGSRTAPTDGARSPRPRLRPR